MWDIPGRLARSTRSVNRPGGALGWTAEGTEAMLTPVPFPRPMRRSSMVFAAALAAFAALECRRPNAHAAHSRP